MLTPVTDDKLLPLISHKVTQWLLPLEVALALATVQTPEIKTMALAS